MNQEVPKPQRTLDERVQWAREMMQEKDEAARELTKELGLPQDAEVYVFAGLYSDIHTTTPEEALAAAKEIINSWNEGIEIFARGQDTPKNSEPPLDRNK